MKNIIFIVSVLSLAAIPSHLYAQQAPIPAQELTLKVTSDDVNTMGKALGKLPFDEVASLIQKLRQQIVEQQQPPAPAKPVEAPK